MTEFQKKMVAEVEKVAKMTEMASEEERQFLMVFAVQGEDSVRAVGQGTQEGLLNLFAHLTDVDEDDRKETLS